MTAAHEPDLSLWDAWPPERVAELLTPVRAPWYVAAGWAIDLFLGGQRREHEDTDVAIPRAHWPEVAEALAPYELFVPGDGLVWPLADAGEHFEAGHQTWVREPATGLWRLDVFREPSAGDTWVCRRDRRIRLPYVEVIERTPDGIPYLRPELVLLFKARGLRSRDEDDFAAVVPTLAPGRRRWLHDLLAQVHPGHRWLERL